MIVKYKQTPAVSPSPCPFAAEKKNWAGLIFTKITNHRSAATIRE